MCRERNKEVGVHLCMFVYVHVCICTCMYVLYPYRERRWSRYTSKVKITNFWIVHTKLIHKVTMILLIFADKFSYR